MLVVLFLAFLGLAASTANSTLPLLMQVEWVIQGYEISFTGFLCELLGISTALKEQIPFSIVQRSSFKTGASLSAGGDLPSAFLHDLFPKEQDALRYLTQRQAPDAALIAAAPLPTMKFAAAAFEPSPDSCLSESFETGFEYFGGDMTRHEVAGATTAVDCCSACLANPLCLSWTHRSNEVRVETHHSGCSLKASPPHDKRKVTEQTELAATSTAGIIWGEDSPAARRLPAPRAIVFHGTTCIHRNESWAGGRLSHQRDINTLLIGRLMVERASFGGGLDLNEYSVILCASVVDEIWVPTEWHVGVMRGLLAQASVTGKRIRVVPEAVDSELFDPALVSPEAIESKKLRGSVATSCRFEEPVDVGGGGGGGGGGGRFVCKTPGLAFEFLSVFKWERRKGWDVLLRAFWRAFSREDHVRLRLRTYLPSFLGGDANITALVNAFALSEFGRPMSELAQVVWEQGEDAGKRQDSLSRAQVRDLYFGADAFVLPTRGEGWGLPIAEAMAMSLPVIVTNYSGPTAYATAENSYLLPVNDRLDEQDYAVPNEDALVGLLRQVVVDSVGDGLTATAAVIKGRRARETMQRLNGAHVVDVVKSHLREEASARGWRF